MTIFDEIREGIEQEKAAKQHPRQHGDGGRLVDIEKYLNHYGIPIAKIKPHKGGTLYCLEQCPFDPNHSPNESSIFQDTAGMLSGQCFHESDKDKKWADFRQAISGNDSLEQFMTGGNGSQRPKEKPQAACSADEPLTEKKPTEPLTPDETRISGRLFKEPASPTCLIEFKGGPFLNRRNVGSCSAAGGTGKTTFFVQACHAWAYGKEFAGFDPKQPLKILLLVAEEDQAEFDRKLWTVGKGEFPAGLYARSVKGVVGPLMTLNNGAPIRTEGYEWLDKTIANHAPLDLLVIDPKSRFFGLDENNNDHNTQWVACLESLAVKHDVSSLFTHHVPKHTKEISQWMGRGGGALVDACRTNFGMIGLTADDGKKLGLEDWWEYVKIKISKINIGPKRGTESYLKFDENGLLVPVDVFRQRTAGMKTHFLYLLANEKTTYTRRELNKENTGKHISDAMKAAFPDFSRGRDIDLLLDLLLEDGSIRQGHFQTATKAKTVFKVLSNSGTGNPE